MSPVELIFALTGVFLLIASCFLPERGKEAEKEGSDRPVELTQEQKMQLEQQIDQLLESRTESVIVKTDDYLSKISNEKIMAVNDFSEQIMQRVDQNNEEIVFLYKRLSEKEDEIKETLKSMEAAKQEMKEAVGEVIRLSRQLNSGIRKAEPATAAKKEKAEKQVKVQKTESEKKQKEPTGQEAVIGQAVPSKLQQPDNKNEEILALYRQGKSILEISKLLGMGQGEVKLVIGLYGLNGKEAKGEKR